MISLSLYAMLQEIVLIYIWTTTVHVHWVLLVRAVKWTSMTVPSFLAIMVPVWMELSHTHAAASMATPVCCVRLISMTVSTISVRMVQHVWMELLTIRASVWLDSEGTRVKSTSMIVPHIHVWMERTARTWLPTMTARAGMPLYWLNKCLFWLIFGVTVPGILIRTVRLISMSVIVFLASMVLLATMLWMGTAVSVLWDLKAATVRTISMIVSMEYVSIMQHALILLPTTGWECYCLFCTILILQLACVCQFNMYTCVCSLCASVPFHLSVHVSLRLQLSASMSIKVYVPSVKVWSLPVVSVRLDSLVMTVLSASTIVKTTTVRMGQRATMDMDPIPVLVHLGELSTEHCYFSSLVTQKVWFMFCRFTGARCETNIDDCVNHACWNGASCLDQIDSYRCSCIVGFTGFLCETSKLHW